MGSSHSSHHPAKFVGLASCESEAKILLICHVTTQSKCHVTLCVGSPHPKYQPTKFGGRESGDIKFFICHVTTRPKCRMTLRVGLPHIRLCSISLVEVEYIVFYFSCNHVTLLVGSLLPESPP